MYLLNIQKVLDQCGILTYLDCRIVIKHIHIKDLQSFRTFTDYKCTLILYKDEKDATLLLMSTVYRAYPDC